MACVVFCPGVAMGLVLDSEADNFPPRRRISTLISSTCPCVDGVVVFCLQVVEESVVDNPGLAAVQEERDADFQAPESTVGKRGVGQNCRSDRHRGVAELTLLADKVENFERQLEQEVIPLRMKITGNTLR